MLNVSLVKKTSDAENLSKFQSLSVSYGFRRKPYGTLKLSYRKKHVDKLKFNFFSKLRS